MGRPRLSPSPGLLSRTTVDGVLPPVVDRSWLANRAAGTVVCDVRWYLDGRSGLEAYQSGHIPEAVFVDLDRCLAGPPSPDRGRHPLPSPETFAESLSQLGIGDGSTVIAYDDQGGVIAARLVWMLRVTGHEAALLDGGLASWEDPLEAGPAQTAAAVGIPAPSFTPRPWPGERLAEADDASDGHNVVLDARSPDRYRGETETIDARAGHIPGARNVPCRENLDGTGSFLPADELRRRFAAAGVTEDSRVVSYCGSGVTACHNLLALELAGFPPGRLYPGSWSAYSHLTDRRAATGSNP
jgi:thiosulfate/3-mercaptopyruvate sulfurtransferase